MPLTIRTPARVAVYAGSGASHSWTWFADLFEQSPAARTVFITEQDVAAGALAGYDVFFVSGGDTFAIAEGLGAPGAAQLERFVRDGGTYVGACAGAYLPLRSSLAPLSLFNFVTARIGNLARHAPAAMHMPEKCCTEYGCRYVVHPVRGEMLLRLHDRAAPDDPRNVTAPLYGGPAMQPSDDVEVLATYADFTAATEFLVDTAAARDMLIGAAAAVRKRLGAGSLYLFGPHFEHPAFPAANRLLMDVVRAAVRDRMPETMPRDGRIADAPPDAARGAYRDFVSSLSNARIMALGLERASYRWRIGRKVYDPEKILVMLAAMFTRARRLDVRGCGGRIAPALSIRWRAAVETVCGCLKQLRDAAQGDAAESPAPMLFTALRTTAAEFLTVYFDFICEDFLPDEGRLPCTTITSISRPPQRSIPCRL